MSSVRIVVCLDIEVGDILDSVDAPIAAYARVHSALTALTTLTGDIDWESSDEWFNIDGESMDEDDVYAARAPTLQREP